MNSHMIDSLSITTIEHPSARQQRSVIRRLVSYNDLWAGPERFIRFAVLLHDRRRRLVGGLLASTHWQWLFISHLWIDETVRRQGYGTQLLLKAEAEARSRGCKHAYLDTFSFQARGFYEAHGYQIFGELHDFPVGHTRHFLWKLHLDDAAGPPEPQSPQPAESIR